MIIRTWLLRGALGVALATMTTGCYKATFISNPNVVRGEEHEEWTSFFIFGLVGHETIDVHEFCPSGEVAEVRTGGNFGTGIVTVLTIGIYAPRKAYVTCSGGNIRNGKAAAPQLYVEYDAAGTPARVERRDGGRVLVGRVSRVEGDDDGWRVDFGAEKAGAQ